MNSRDQTQGLLARSSAGATDILLRANRGRRRMDVPRYNGWSDI